MSIPSVDLSEFLSGDAVKKNQFVQNLGKAYEDIGFVAVKNHGISDALITDLFVDCAAAERTAVLDDIAYPGEAKPEFSAGVAFFNSFRDLTASGFWSSKVGMADLQYMGNTFVPEWKGCPDEAMKKLGVAPSTGD